MSDLSFLLFSNTELIAILMVWVLTAIAVLSLFFILPAFSSGNQEKVSSLPFVHNSRRNAWKREDVIMCLLITLLFAFPALHQLGTSSFPSTTWQASKEQERQEIVLELTDSTRFTAIYTIYGEGDNNSLASGYMLGTNGMIISGSNDSIAYEELAVLSQGRIFEYSITRGEYDYRYIKLISLSPNDTLSEIGFYDDRDHCFRSVRIHEDAYADSPYPAQLLIDEQDKLTASPVYYDQAYFDEVYHARNAAEIASGQDMYATVHPLLGTNMMALSIRLLSLSPFAWRLPGALCSIAMVPMMYALMHLFTGSTLICSAASVLTAADFMHMTTGRIGTLEPMSVLLIMIMFCWMLKYAMTSFYDTLFRKQMMMLCMSGIFMGLAIACKWTGCYSAVGLAIILFSCLYERLSEYHQAKNLLLSGNGTAQQRQEAVHITSVFGRYTLYTILFCFLFFIFIPAAIYLLSYLPDRVWKGDVWSIANVWKQNVYMFNYHMNLQAEHPYQSQWYQWLLDLRPIWYYYGMDQSGYVHTIACFSNPLLTWAGIPAVLYIVYLAVFRKDRNAWFILVGYLTALLPWVSLVERCVFAYHFYPASIFTALAVAYSAIKLMKHRYARYAIIAFLIVYVLNFIVFLPVTAGFGTSTEYIKSLEWLKGWYFG